MKLKPPDWCGIAIVAVFLTLLVWLLLVTGAYLIKVLAP